MASPQLEDGYTRIANELLEALLLYRIPGQELRVVLAVMRKTYGYGKKEDKISFGQLSKLTDIPRVRVIEHVKSLVSKRVLGSLNVGTRTPRTIWINKDFSQWLPSPKKETSPNGETIPSPVIGNRSSPVIGTHKRKKERIKKTTVFPDWMPKELWEVFLSHRKSMKAPVTNLTEDGFIDRFAKLREKGFEPRFVIETIVERGWKWFKPEWVESKKGASDLLFGTCKKCKRPNIPLVKQGLCSDCTRTEAWT
jgi:phage replication O-like protein O